MIVSTSLETKTNLEGDAKKTNVIVGIDINSKMS